MKHILYIIFLLCFVGISHIKAQSEYDIVIDNINKIKKDKSQKIFNVDTSLIESIINIEKTNLKSKNINKDSIRSILRSRNNFDYNVEYFEMPLSKTKKTDKILKQLQNEKFKDILNDTLYNNIGITIDKGLLNNNLRVLATQNYLDFDTVKYTDVINWIDGSKTKIRRLYGVTKTSKIFINTYYSNKIFKENRSVRESIDVNSDNRFEIKVDISEKNKGRLNIEVIDSTGKIISYIPVN